MKRDVAAFVGAVAAGFLVRSKARRDPSLRGDEASLRRLLAEKGFPAHPAVFAFEARWGGTIFPGDDFEWLLGAYGCIRAGAREPRADGLVPVALGPDDQQYFLDAQGLGWRGPSPDESEPGAYARDGDTLVARILLWQIAWSRHWRQRALRWEDARGEAIAADLGLPLVPEASDDLGRAWGDAKTLVLELDGVTMLASDVARHLRGRGGRDGVGAGAFGRLLPFFRAMEGRRSHGVRSRRIFDGGGRMTPQDASVVAADAVDPRLLRAGALSALLLVVGYLATFPLYAVVGGPPPGGAEAHLAAYGGHLGGWWGILGLMVSTDLLLPVIWFALYQALKGVDRHVMLLALLCEGLFVALDLAVTWPNHAALFALGGDYAGATEAERAAIVAAAGYAVAVQGSPVLTLYAILFPALGIFLGGLVMLKGAFGKGAAIVAILVGLTGVVAWAGPHVSGALAMAPVVNALLVMVWYVLVAVRLHRLARG